MNCELHTEAIDALVDGTLGQTERAELERHLAGCPSCRALAADLKAIRAASARLPVHHPPARVWERLSARLPQGPVAAERDAGPKWFAWLWAAPRWRLASVGGTLAVAVLLLALVVPRLRPSAPLTQPARPGQTASAATAVHPGDPNTVESVEMELRQAEMHYKNAIGGLEKMATAGESTLDPEVAATLRQNLTVVDQAIAESRTALQSQPTSELAQESLFEAFRRKVGLLQDTVALMNEMRKGNQAEAAKILGSMNK